MGREEERDGPIGGPLDAEAGDGSADGAASLVAGSGISRPVRAEHWVLLRCRLFLATSRRPVEAG